LQRCLFAGVGFAAEAEAEIGVVVGVEDEDEVGVGAGDIGAGIVAQVANSVLLTSSIR
jgi:hypothetical protein